MKGRNVAGRVTLSMRARGNAIVTADAVKFGGGMGIWDEWYRYQPVSHFGNISFPPKKGSPSPNIRYWLQYADFQMVIHKQRRQ